MRGLLLVLGLLAIALVLCILLYGGEARRADTVTTVDSVTAVDGAAPTLRGNPIDVAADSLPEEQISPAAETPGTFVETTREGASKLRVDVEAGVLEGIVISGTKPVSDGGKVEIWHTVLRVGIEVERPARATHELEIRQDGTFRLEEVLPGRYWVRVLAKGTSPREVSIIIPEGKPSHRIVIVLGGATLHGRVFDENGKTMPRMAVRAVRHGGSIGDYATLEGMTDENGEYALTGLMAGRHGVTVYPGDLPYDSQTSRYGMKTVGPGEYVPFDFGSAHPVVRWTGTVRNRNGNAVQGGGALIVTAIGGGEGIQLRFEDGGVFDFSHVRGTYHVAVTLAEGRFEIKREYALEDRALQQDIVIPGAQVTGRVVNRAGDGPLHASQSVSYTPKGKSHHSRKSVKITDDGTFSIDGLAPGVYVVSGWPWKLGGTDGRDVEFEVRDTDLHIELELEASPP